MSIHIKKFGQEYAIDPLSPDQLPVCTPKPTNNKSQTYEVIDLDSSSSESEAGSSTLPTIEQIRAQIEKNALEIQRISARKSTFCDTNYATKQDEAHYGSPYSLGLRYSSRNKRKRSIENKMQRIIDKQVKSVVSHFYPSPKRARTVKKEGESASHTKKTFVVEKILEYKGGKCLVEWKNYGSEHNSWEPLTALEEDLGPYAYTLLRKIGVYEIEHILYTDKTKEWCKVRWKGLSKTYWEKTEAIAESLGNKYFESLDLPVK